MNAFNANAAPIAAPPLARQSPDASVQQSDPGVSGHAGARAGSRTTALSTPGARVSREQAATPLTPRQPQPAGHPMLRRVSRPPVVIMSHAMPPTTTSVTADVPSPPAVPPAPSPKPDSTSSSQWAATDVRVSPIEPPAPSPNQGLSSGSQSTVPLMILSVAPETIRSRLPDASAPPVTKAPATVTAEVGSPAKQQKQQVVIGAVAPSRASNWPQRIPLTQSFAPLDGITADALQPGFLQTRSAVTRPSERQHVSSVPESPQAEPEQRQSQAETDQWQGMMVLDGMVLGRWVIDHLERSAARPSAMTTTIDPRISATYPGAPTGA